MAYGFELYNAAGTKTVMSTENFGLMVVDVFDVNPGTSGSTTYTELDWHNNIYAQGITNQNQTLYSRTYMSYAFVNISITVNASNIPTVSWSPSYTKTTCMVGDSNDSSSWNAWQFNSFKANGYCLGGDKRPKIKIIVLAG